MLPLLPHRAPGASFRLAAVAWGYRIGGVFGIVAIVVLADLRIDSRADKHYLAANDNPAFCVVALVHLAEAGDDREGKRAGIVFAGV